MFSVGNHPSLGRKLQEHRSECSPPTWAGPMAGLGVTDAVPKEQGGLFAQVGGRRDFSCQCFTSTRFFQNFREEKLCLE